MHNYIFNKVYNCLELTAVTGLYTDYDQFININMAVTAKYPTTFPFEAAP